MKPLDTILVGTVFGPRSDAAVRTAAVLAEAYQSKIILLHAVNEQAYAVISEHPGIAELEKRLQERHLPVGNLPSGDVRVVVVSGSAAQAISETASREHADLIVMGAGESSDTRDSRLGTTTTRVMRNSSIPVWVVEPQAPEKPQRILCPVDTSEASRRALKNAHHLSQTFEAELTVLHVLEPLSTLYGGIDMPDNNVELGFLSPQKKQFDEFLDRLEFRDSKWNVKTRRGKAHKEILAEVKESGADLLVMGTVGRAGVARFLIGSVTDKVTRQLPCSLLTVKARDIANQRLKSDLSLIDECMKRGKVMLDEGAVADAIREFDRCLDISPTLVAAWEAKAQAYGLIGDGASATRSRENAQRIRAFHQQ